MTIELKPEQERIIQQQLASGHFRSVEEVLSTALASLPERPCERTRVLNRREAPAPNSTEFAEESESHAQLFAESPGERADQWTSNDSRRLLATTDLCGASCSTHPLLPNSPIPVLHGAWKWFWLDEVDRASSLVLLKSDFTGFEIGKWSRGSSFYEIGKKLTHSYKSGRKVSPSSLSKRHAW